MFSTGDFESGQHKALVVLTSIVGTLLFCLIMVGAMVRVTGSGMGCPDWPTCFGEWIPPLSVTDLPTNYRELYADHGYLSNTFNVTKTWTEYLNRLLGVLFGLVVISLGLFSTRYWKTDAKICLASLAMTLLVLLQGFWGAIVVDSNLSSTFVSVHTLLAFVTVVTYAFIAHRVSLLTAKLGIVGNIVLSRAVMGLMVVQLILGLLVREQTDQVTHGVAAGVEWANVSGVYPHVLVGILLFIVCSASYFGSSATARSGYLSLVIGLLFALASGLMVLAFELPSIAQALHLLAASIALALAVRVYLVGQAGFFK